MRASDEFDDRADDIFANIEAARRAGDFLGQIRQLCKIWSLRTKSIAAHLHDAPTHQRSRDELLAGAKQNHIIVAEIAAIWAAAAEEAALAYQDKRVYSSDDLSGIIMGEAENLYAEVRKLGFTSEGALKTLQAAAEAARETTGRAKAEPRSEPLAQPTPALEDAVDPKTADARPLAGDPLQSTDRIQQARTSPDEADRERHGAARETAEPRPKTTADAKAEALAVGDTTLLGQIVRYEARLASIDLPSTGLTSLEQAQAAGRLSTTYRDMRLRQIERGLEPLPKDDRVKEAERLSVDFYRKPPKPAPRPAAPPQTPDTDPRPKNELKSKLDRLEAKAVKLGDGTLLSLIARYKVQRNVTLPPDGVRINDPEQAKAAAGLHSTFKNLQARLTQHALKPLPRDERVLKAHRQSAAFYRDRKATVAHDPA